MILRRECRQGHTRERNRIEQSQTVRENGKERVSTGRDRVRTHRRIPIDAHAYCCPEKYKRAKSPIFTCIAPFHVGVRHLRKQVVKSTTVTLLPLSYPQKIWERLCSELASNCGWSPWTGVFCGVVRAYSGLDLAHFNGIFFSCHLGARDCMRRDGSLDGRRV